MTTTATAAAMTQQHDNLFCQKQQATGEATMAASRNKRGTGILLHDNKHNNDKQHQTGDNGDQQYQAATAQEK